MPLYSNTRAAHIDSHRLRGGESLTIDGDDAHLPPALQFVEERSAALRNRVRARQQTAHA